MKNLNLNNSKLQELSSTEQNHINGGNGAVDGAIDIAVYVGGQIVDGVNWLSAQLKENLT